jgi:hypothetical protein
MKEGCQEKSQSLENRRKSPFSSGCSATSAFVCHSAGSFAATRADIHKKRVFSLKGGLAAFEVLAAGFGSGFGPDFVSAAFASAGLVAVA